MMILQVAQQITDETLLGLSPRTFIEILAGIVVGIGAIFAYVYNVKENLSCKTQS